MRSDRRAGPIESVVETREVGNLAVPSGPGTRPVILFVLGTQRSGTSAITRVLSLCGGTLPAGMLGADAGNPRGNWEPRKVIAINESILHRHGSAWFDPSLRLQEDGAFSAEEKATCIAEIVAYLKTLPTAPLVVIKDPRITTLSDLWFEASRLTGFDSAVVIAVRHPEEVIASVASSWQLAPELSSALWLKYNLLAERHTRGMPRVFVGYTNLLEDWRREIKRISMALPVDLNTHDEDAIDEFLTPDLRRQKNRGPVASRFGTDWISAVYDAQCVAARDECPDEGVLDRIFESYRASEHDFRSAFEGYRKLSGGVRSRIFRPAVVKPMIELVAMAHRRRGTWA
ncbi:sulfotransferase family protein [Mycobacterium seoulense]|uniref:sulfotransferase family protein n=1 Tax=Mycobacterium seoulense TaxID=386911 RepID=UPI003CE6E333